MKAMREGLPGAGWMIIFAGHQARNLFSLKKTRSAEQTMALGHPIDVSKPFLR
jgi:hypothetical protein